MRRWLIVLTLCLAPTLAAAQRPNFVGTAVLNSGDVKCSPSTSGQVTNFGASWVSPYAFTVYAHRAVTQWMIGGLQNPYAEGWNWIKHVPTGELMAVWGGEARWPDQTAITQWEYRAHTGAIQINPGDTLQLGANCAAYFSNYNKVLIRSIATILLYDGP